MVGGARRRDPPYMLWLWMEGAMAEVRSVDEQVAEYVNKHAALMLELGEPVMPFRFYREVFPEGFLQDACRVNPAAPHDGKFVAIANVVHERKDGNGVYRKNHYVLDDLTQITKWTNQVAFLSPCSFLGGAKDLKHLRYLHAIVVDARRAPLVGTCSMSCCCPYGSGPALYAGVATTATSTRRSTSPVRENGF